MRVGRDAAQSEAQRKLRRKFFSVFLPGRDGDPADHLDGLGDANVREKVLAYGLSFAQHFFTLEQAETAALLLGAYRRARSDSNLPEDRKALSLLAKVLAACAEGKRGAAASLQSRLRYSTAATGSAAEREGLAEECEAADKAYAQAKEQLRRAEAAASAYALPDADGLGAEMGRLSVGGIPPRAGSAPPGSPWAGGGLTPRSLPRSAAGVAAGGTPRRLSGHVASSGGRVSVGGGTVGRVSLGGAVGFCAGGGVAGGVGGRACGGLGGSSFPPPPLPASGGRPSEPAAAPFKTPAPRARAGWCGSGAAGAPGSHPRDVKGEGARLSAAGVPMGAGGSPPPTHTRCNLAVKADLPTPPTARERTSAAVAAAAQSAFRPTGADGPHPSFLGGGRQSAAPPQRAETAEAAAAAGAAAGAAAVESWRRRAAALRSEANALLSALPPKYRKASSKAEAKTEAKAEAKAGPSWVYRYLLYEPLVTSDAGGAADLRTAGRPPRPVTSLAGPAAAAAAAAGSLACVVLRRGPGVEASLTVRLFSDALPKLLPLLLPRIEKSATGGAASRPAPASSASSGAGRAAIVPLPAFGEDAAIVAATKAEGKRLPHERTDLVSLRPPAGAAGPALAFCLDAAPPFGTDGIVLGRVIDGQEALAQLCASAAAGPVTIASWIRHSG